MDMNDPASGNTDPDENTLDPNEPYPVVIKPFHFGLLCVATLGIYHIWWQYKCWKYFKEKEQLDIFPAVRAIFFLFFGVALFSRIAIYCKEYDHQANYNPIVIWGTCIGINLFGYLPIPVSLLSLFAFVPMIWPLREFNFYFTGNKNGYRGDKLNDRQMILIALGIVCWFFLVYGLVYGKDLPK